MEEKNKINVRGSIAGMGIGDTLNLSIDLYRSRFIRTTASDLARDLKRKYTVNVCGETITVTRTA